MLSRLAAALALVSALSESSTTFARSRSYVQSALASDHITWRPSLVHVGNSPPISFSFFTGKLALAGFATETVGAVAPTWATATV